MMASSSQCGLDSQIKIEPSDIDIQSLDNDDDSDKEDEDPFPFIPMDLEKLKRELDADEEIRDFGDKDREKVRQEILANYAGAVSIAGLNFRLDEEELLEVIYDETLFPIEPVSVQKQTYYDIIDKFNAEQAASDEGTGDTTSVKLENPEEQLVSPEEASEKLPQEEEVPTEKEPPSRNSDVPPNYVTTEDIVASLIAALVAETAKQETERVTALLSQQPPETVPPVPKRTVKESQTSKKDTAIIHINVPFNPLQKPKVPLAQNLQQNPSLAPFNPRQKKNTAAPKKQ